MEVVIIYNLRPCLQSIFTNSRLLPYHYYLRTGLSDGSVLKCNTLVAELRELLLTNWLSIHYRGEHGGALNTAIPQKKLTNTASPNHTRNHSTANNFISLNPAARKTQTSHTVRFEITATPQIEILFTASPHQKNINTANPHAPLFQFKRRHASCKWQL